MATSARQEKEDRDIRQGHALIECDEEARDLAFATLCALKFFGTPNSAEALIKKARPEEDTGNAGQEATLDKKPRPQRSSNVQPLRVSGLGLGEEVGKPGMLRPSALPRARNCFFG